MCLPNNSLIQTTKKPTILLNVPPCSLYFDLTIFVKSIFLKFLLQRNLKKISDLENNPPCSGFLGAKHQRFVVTTVIIIHMHLLNDS